MPSLPDVSVVISTFNRSHSLALTLESLARQTLPPDVDYEVIVVDNNSTDGTRALVEKMIAGGFARLRYHFEARQGVSYGRNAGIQAACAPILAFTDDDNDVSPHWVATIKEALDADAEVEVIGGPIVPQWPSPPPAWLDRRHWSPVAIMDYGDRPFHSNAARPVCFLTANLAVRKSTFERVGCFSPKFPRGQDHEFLLRFWRAGGQALYLPALVADARIQPARLTRQYHCEWHRNHGAVAASMRLQESIGPGGALLDAPVRGPELFGTPLFVYAELSREVAAWLRALPRRQTSVTLHHSDRVRYLAGYLRQRAGGRRWRRRLGELFAFVTRRSQAAAEKAPLPPSRLALVLLLMIGLVGGSLYDIAFDREDWPLSQYPMFSDVDGHPTLRSLRLVGVTREEVPREIALLDGREIGPLDQCRLSTALARTFGNESRRSIGPALLRGVLDRYEARRATGEHDGPPLQAVRAYDMTWTLDPAARNVDRPDVKRLIAEVRQ